MNLPPSEQVRAGEIARGAIQLAKELCKNTIYGVRLDREVEQYIRDEGGEPALKGYHPAFSIKPYEHTICLGVDKDVVHGVPTKLVCPNHLVTIDLVVGHKNWYADTARTFTHSDDPVKRKFAEMSMTIFESSLQVIQAQNKVDFFGTMVESGAKIQNYQVVKEYCGHGIGKAIHADPQVLNYHTSSEEVFQAGQSYAVEPVLAIKPYVLRHHPHDGFTVQANCLVSHNEDTIFVGERGAINLTGNQS
jgi:methionyl aminopeptidase